MSKNTSIIPVSPWHYSPDVGDVRAPFWRPISLQCRRLTDKIDFRLDMFEPCVRVSSVARREYARLNRVRVVCRMKSTGEKEYLFKKINTYRVPRAFRPVSERTLRVRVCTLQTTRIGSRTRINCAGVSELPDYRTADLFFSHAYSKKKKQRSWTKRKS